MALKLIRRPIRSGAIKCIPALSANGKKLIANIRHD